MIKIICSSEKEIEQVLTTIERSTECIFLHSGVKCVRGRLCKDCILENLKCYCGIMKGGE